MNWLRNLQTLPRHAAILACAWTLAVPAQAALAPSGSTAIASDYAASPPQVVQGADPFVMINLSVELTQQAEAFTDGPQIYANGTVCPNRVSGNGVCYTNAETYIGYFDPAKCYTYVTSASNSNRVQDPRGPYGPNHPTTSTIDADFFRPTGAATNHQCSSGFSGNYMNWATMTALDEFRSAMTGGARIYDTAGASAQTLLARAYRFDTWGFVNKIISSGGITSSGTLGTVTFTTNPSTVTPFTTNVVAATNNWGTGNPSGHRVRFYDGSANLLGEYNVIVEVCNPSAGLESNCVQYTDGTNTWYKPEGLLQKNAVKMRYALSSYTARNTATNNVVQGGVIRANAKYIGYYAPTTSGGLTVNPYAETDANGLVAYDPDCVVSACSPMQVPWENDALGAPLTWPSAWNIGATPPSSLNGVVNSGVINYINQFALSAGRYKGFDPASELYYEGLRYIMGLGHTPQFSTNAGLSGDDDDGYPIYHNWLDPITTARSCQANFSLYVGDQFAHEDDYVPGRTACNSTQCTQALGYFNAVTETNTVGGLEGLGNIGNSTRPTSGRGDGFWIAGMAYWANTNDVRPDADATIGIPGTQRVKTFMIDTQEFNSAPPTRQANQLWLAAKFGGFDQLSTETPPDPNDGASNKDTPNPEWTTDTATPPDPDAYVLASQPTNLVSGLNQVFNKVNQATATSSAAAVVANSATGVGGVYQALYEPRLTNNGNVVTWSGRLRAFFVDSQGRIREDSDNNNKLTNADQIVRYVNNNVNQTVTVDLISPSSGLTTQTGLSVRNINSIWDASDELGTISDLNVVTNRGWPAPGVTQPLASSGRYIKTWVDLDGDGIVDDEPDTSPLSATDEYIPFEAPVFAKFTAAADGTDMARYLGLDSTSAATDALVQTLAGDLVKFIRGDESLTGFRNRTISGQKLRLGDIVHSASLVVGAPDADYDRTYADNGYALYYQQYKDRRQVVYVGANDGMLHAFNAGFFDPAQLEFKTSTTNGETAHPLGSELWAYVPYNLLPHLQWLADINYPHSYYVDGKPQAFDVNIFPADADHPRGWGTILVVGFRLGGGDITVDIDSDADGTNQVTMRSAYLVFDITNPEKQPQLLAEITHPELGFTTSLPTVVKKRVSATGDFSTLYGASGNNRWYLVFGSGPYGGTATEKAAALRSGISYQNAKIFAFDLHSKQLVDLNGTAAGVNPLDTGNANAFVGGLAEKDWEQDYTDEVVYFGTVASTTAGSLSALGGQLYRLVMPTGFDIGANALGSVVAPSLVTMLTGNNSGSGQPFYAPPLAEKNSFGQPWVFAGTGRFLSSGDITPTFQNSFYGIREIVSSGSVDLTSSSAAAKSSLVDTTGVRVYTDGTIDNGTNGTGVTVAPSVTVTTFSGLVSAIQKTRGWFFDFSTTSTKFVDQILASRGQLAFVDYVTSGNSCSPAGESFLNLRNMLTGTGSPYAPLGTDPNNTLLVNSSVSLGYGQSHISGVHTSPTGGIGIMTSGPSGQMTLSSVRTKPVVLGRLSWRELPIPY